MRYNLHFDYCSLILLVAIIFSLLLRGLNKGRTNRLFYIFTATLFVANITDILSVMLEECSITTAQNLWVRQIVDYTYFLSRNMTDTVYFFYVASLLGIRYKIFADKRTKNFVFAPISILILLILSNIFNNKIFYYGTVYEYNRGPWMVFLYVINLYYIILSIAVLFRYKKSVNVKKVVALLFFLPIQITAAITQLIFQYQRLDIFATTILVIVVAVGVQRYEEDTDYTTGVNSYNAFLNDMRKYAVSYTPIRMVLFKFYNHKEIRSSKGFERYAKINRAVADRLIEMDKAVKANSKIYYLENGVFAMVASDVYRERILHLARMISAAAEEAIQQGNKDIAPDACVCLLRCPEDIDTYAALTNFINNMDERLPKGIRLVRLSAVSGTKDFKISNNMDEIIKRGIKQNSFKVYYQPIYSVKEKRFKSAEALIRLNDVKYGFISPGLFIPAAERSGAIHQIGEFVLKDVCRFMSSDKYKSLGMEQVEINLSLAQCIEGNFVDRVRNIVETFGIRPEKINLELTETASILDTDIAEKNITALRKLGFSFALDDYGTGYSSIKRIAFLPLDIVKLDKSIADDIDNPQMLAVTTNTIRMLNNLNKKIVVEGVEDKETADKFIELGCDYIQGYYYARPMPEEELVNFIKAYERSSNLKQA